MATKISQIRYGVVGLGHIAQVAVLPAFKQAKKNSVLTALVTDDKKKASALSRKYKVPQVYNYGQFDELLRSDVVDALYICLPNHLHTDFTVRALQAGIHVLCEKPLALSEADCLRIADTAESTGCFAMTAYRLHFEEANLAALKLCKSKKLGDIRYFTSDFSFQVTDPDNIRLQADAGGGPVWDIGIYCINAARTLFQAEPEEVFALATAGDDKRFSEVEEMAGVVMRFSKDRLASFTCSFGADTAGSYDVYGTKGSLRLENAYEYAAQRKLILRKDGKAVKTTNFKKVDQFAPEIVYFSECIRKNQQPEPSAYEGLADVRVIRAIYESIEKRQPVRISGSGRHEGPSEDMAAHYPGQSEPETVNVQSPSN
jgi:predicted dehydrogenase